MFRFKQHVARNVRRMGAQCFANGVFGVSPAEAAAMDPQQRLLLEHSIEAFSQNQHKVMQQMTDMLSGNQGIDQWAEMSRRNLELFQNSLNIFNPQMSGENGTVHSETSVAKMDSETDQRPRSETDIDRLRQQMAEMQKQLNALSKD